MGIELLLNIISDSAFANTPRTQDIRCNKRILKNQVLFLYGKFLTRKIYKP